MAKFSKKKQLKTFNFCYKHGIKVIFPHVRIFMRGEECSQTDFLAFQLFGKGTPLPSDSCCAPSWRAARSSRRPISERFFNSPPSLLTVFWEHFSPFLVIFENIHLLFQNFLSDNLGQNILEQTKKKSICSKYFVQDCLS